MSWSSRDLQENISTVQLNNPQIFNQYASLPAQYQSMYNSYFMNQNYALQAFLNQNNTKDCYNSLQNYKMTSTVPMMATAGLTNSYTMSPAMIQEVTL